MTGIMKRTERTGWVEVGVYQPESVADHTFRTAFLCMLYADMEGLDPLKLLRLALIHDLPEIIIGDLTPSQKTPDNKEKEKTAIGEILSLLPTNLRKKYFNVWKEYQEGDTKEAKAVLQLEKIEMALQAKEYEKLGIETKIIDRFIRSAENFISWPELKRLLSNILEDKVR
jgi:5'-deoxynucleotidase YfbR-like HD superfamily hydrolase